MKCNTGKQMAGFMLSPDWVNKPSLSEEYIKEMADHGYCAAILFIRHMHKTVWDRKVHDCVEHMTEYAHCLGLKFVLDTDPKWWGCEFVEEHPEAVMKVFGSYTVTVADGSFEFRADYPKVEGICIIDTLAALFQEKDGAVVHLPPDQFTYEWQNYGLPKGGVQLRGKIQSLENGKLTAYVSFKACAFIDVANPAYLRRQQELLDFYSDVPLDGFGWDEPGKGMGQLNYFKAGDAFLELFRTRNGYDLIEKLIYLDHLDSTPKAVQTRGDYYSTLNEMNYTAQRQHNEYAKKRFGDRLILGTHQTWSGIPTDLATGTIDYFKLGNILTASWTDGAWSCELKYQAFHYMLADGIRQELGLADAYYNDWTKELPAIEDMHFATRFKMLYHVNWFNIFFSHFSENEVNFRLEPLRCEAIADVKKLDEFNDMLGGEFYPHSDIAWLYLWEGLAAAPKWLTRVFYTSCANIAHHLTDSGLFATMIGTKTVAEAEIGDKQFSFNGQTWKTLIVPYAYAIPKDCYRKIMALVDAGVSVVFIGPQPEFDSEDGISIGSDFADRVGIVPVNLKQYQEYFAVNNKIPDINEWEPEWIDFACPVKATNGIVVRDAEEKIMFVKAPDRSLYFMPMPDPREDLITLLHTFTVPVLETYAENAYVRIFQSRTNCARRVIYCAAKGRIADAPLVPDRYARNRPPRKHTSMKALIRSHDGELSINGGTWCACLMEGELHLQTIGDAKKVIWSAK